MCNQFLLVLPGCLTYIYILMWNQKLGLSTIIHKLKNPWWLNKHAYCKLKCTHSNFSFICRLSNIRTESEHKHFLELDNGIPSLTVFVCFSLGLTNSYIASTYFHVHYQSGPLLPFPFGMRWNGCLSFWDLSILRITLIRLRLTGCFPHCEEESLNHYLVCMATWRSL